MSKTSIGSHTKPNQGDTNTWLTPPHVLRALGRFDLDPCAAPSPRPWPTATRHFELPQDGLYLPWDGPWCYACGAVDGCKYLSEPEIYCLNCRELLSPFFQPHRIWLNPPYGKEVDPWLDKLSQHKHGIALIFARTETSTWFTHIWPKAHSIFFFEGRLFFHHTDGTRGKSNAGGPSALISYSYFDTEAIRTAWENGLKGSLLEQWVGRAPHGN